MAKPRVEQGFLMLPLDLLPAVLTADLANREMIVLAEALLQRYGPERRERVVLDPPSIEAATGLCCKNARRALKSLVAARILVPSAGNTYLVNDDYESWMPGGEPYVGRLAGGLVRFCLGAVERFGKRAKASEGVGVQLDSTPNSIGVQLDCFTSVEKSPVGLLYSCRKESSGTPTTVDASANGVAASHVPGGTCDTPLACGRAPASEETDLELDSERSLSRTRTHEGREPFETPPSGKPKSPFVAPGLSDAEAAVVAEAAEFADREFPELRFGTQIRQNPRAVHGAPLGHWLPALVALKRVPPSRWSWRYLLGIVGRMTPEEAAEMLAPPASARNGAAGANGYHPGAPDRADPVKLEENKRRMVEYMAQRHGRKGGGRV